MPPSERTRLGPIGAPSARFLPPGLSPTLTLGLLQVCPSLGPYGRTGHLASLGLYWFVDQAPINAGERTTPLAATTSSRSRCLRLETSISAAVAIFDFSITGKRLFVTSATSSYAGQSGPPPIRASMRIVGPGRPAATNTECSSKPNSVRAPVAPSACLIQLM